MNPPATYRFSMPPKCFIPCPVPQCPYKSEFPATMRRHFRNCHPEDTIIIEEEGPLPRCPRCRLFQKDVGPKHQSSMDCQRAAANYSRRLDAQTQATAQQACFYVNGQELKSTTEFRYLGRILDNEDNDEAAVQRNIARARQKWGMIGRILSQNHTSPQAMASFYNAIIQSVLLYGSESWVLTQTMLRQLESFHHRCTRYITGRHICKLPDDTWECPNTAETLEQAGLWTISQYI